MISDLENVNELAVDLEVAFKLFIDLTNNKTNNFFFVLFNRLIVIEHIKGLLA